jgi:hypothetical protein
VIAVKEQAVPCGSSSRPKATPSVGEETIDPYHDLYRGKIFPLFRCAPTGFNFMPVICLDYVYRDLYQSNISAIIDRANQLFYQTRQRLDLLAYSSAIRSRSTRPFATWSTAFMASTWPTPRGCATPPRSSATPQVTPPTMAPRRRTFGCSMVILHRSHKLAPVQLAEFATDDFDGLPVCRLRFGTGDPALLLQPPAVS